VKRANGRVKARPPQGIGMLCEGKRIFKKKKMRGANAERYSVLIVGYGLTGHGGKPYSRKMGGMGFFQEVRRGEKGDVKKVSPQRASVQSTEARKPGDLA